MPSPIGSGRARGRGAMGEIVIDIVTNPKYKSSAYTLKPAGLPYTETEEKIVMNADIKKWTTDRKSVV